MTKALAMISGGLDSTLAAKLIKNQGIDVIGICFKSYFFGAENAKRAAEQIEIPIKIVDFSKEHLNMVKNPKHGFGKNMNPCIDCHAMMMNYTGKLLEKYKADFIITGEVLNQRPMSQNKASLNLVKKESGFSDKILRPLCAKNLLPTKMELEGLVDREKLLGISGRGRKVQMELAEKWNIKEYPSPAGGCKLTEPSYSKRLKDLLEHNENPSDKDIYLLRYGRHFRISDNAKIISTRTEKEAKEIKEYLDSKNLIFFAVDFNGSMCIITGKPLMEDIEFAGSITARYSKGKNEKIVKIKYGNFNNSLNNYIESKPASEEDINKYII
ncbi:tRNA-specific 2-thiouridylase MnmA [Clostridium acetireducens DSM 10703]|jgi:tRNA-specific 2-thiouridylase|uniref:tRNA-specific 2-thiouridylase MnmA n=1 Tax=Clostridium acetireducens DSM 10703 TaxID=1121290 RepID=A0A1E8EZP0_9CLOT|nr:tRNA 4-thiouridine(8) synthase ThiI [Clostridium acetireducens]OFI06187.1 tRNA-specific 2-thiouridylase MnmA [Clostridium acetireducens DSM 10703]